MTGRAGERTTPLMRQMHVFFVLADLDLALLVVLIHCLVWRSS
jgi:hypothetical protein